MAEQELSELQKNIKEYIVGMTLQGHTVTKAEVGQMFAHVYRVNSQGPRHGVDFITEVLTIDGIEVSNDGALFVSETLLNEAKNTKS